MFVVIVDVSVNEESVDAFKVATEANARSSVKEPGIARFDVLQDRSDPTHFQLVEVYRTADDPARHKETEHYKTWRETVAPMMARDRTNVKYDSVFPDESGW